MSRTRRSGHEGRDAGRVLYGGRGLDLHRGQAAITGKPGSAVGAALFAKLGLVPMIRRGADAGGGGVMAMSRMLAAIAVLFSAASPAVACPNFRTGSPSISAFNLVVDGTAQFVGGNRIQISVTRTIKGPQLKKLTVADAASPPEEVWCPPGKPWTLFGDDPYPIEKPLRGRFFLIRYDNGKYLVHWFLPRRKD